MKDDPIVAAVRQRRREILESFGGDFEAMSRAMMRKQHDSGHRVVRLEKKALQPGQAPNPYPLHPLP
jgi:hypothetical protein